MANARFDKRIPARYMGQMDLTRENLTRWTVAGVVTMAALLAAKAMFFSKRKRGR